MDTMFIDFVNSEWYDGHGNLKPDRLLRAQWLTTFRRRWGLAGRGGSSPDESLGSHPFFGPRRTPLDEKAALARPNLSKGALEEMLRLRELLRRIAETVAAGRDVAPRDIRLLNGFLESVDVRRRLHGRQRDLRLDSVPLLGGDEWLVGTIALSAAEFLVSGDRGRLKLCTNSGCGWVFYDETKNRSRRWCDANLCGNLFKVRRYRKRHRANPPVQAGVDPHTM